MKERLDRLEEGLEVIMRLLGNAPAQFAGRYYQLEGANPRPKPAQRPRIPILIGTTSERRMLRIVARYADEWDVPGTITPAAYRAKSQRLAAYCRDINRDPREIRHCVSTAFLIGRNERELRRRIEAMQQLMPHLAPLDAAGVRAALQKEEWLIGTPEEIIAALQALADEGVERVMLQHNNQADFEALELIAHEVMPVVAS
jgi:alkanesulfonate monooxygenase SsuD/methylene tetrahydromethanopterin reductase-like flavin-dependent oxidoreductase (luciferase family)